MVVMQAGGYCGIQFHQDCVQHCENLLLKVFADTASNAVKELFATRSCIAGYVSIVQQQIAVHKSFVTLYQDAVGKMIAHEWHLNALV